MNEAAPPSLLIGMTGGIGSGKTTVAELFARLGARIIDTDELSRNLTQADGAAITPIRAAFGGAYIDADGAMDRKRMRELVFSTPEAKTRLEAILHPLIFAQAQQQAALPTAAPYTVLVVPLLTESGSYRKLVQRILVVDCPEETQLQRTMQRSGLERAAALSIMAHQAGRGERLRQADDVILNDGSLEDLSAQVGKMHEKYLSLCHRSN